MRICELKKACESIIKFKIRIENYHIMCRASSLYITLNIGDNWKIKFVISEDGARKQQIVIWCQVLLEDRSKAYKSLITDNEHFVKDLEDCVWWGLNVIKKKKRRRW